MSHTSKGHQCTRVTRGGAGEMRGGEGNVVIVVVSTMRLLTAGASLDKPQVLGGPRLGVAVVPPFRSSSVGFCSRIWGGGRWSSRRSKVDFL